MSQDPNSPQSDNPYPPPPPPLFDDQPAAAASAPPPPPHYNPPPNVPGGLTKDERMWGMLAHFSGLVALFVLNVVHFGFLAFLAPLVIYLVKKEESAFVGDQAKEALNFMISVGILFLGIFFISLVLIWTVIVPIIMVVVSWVLAIGAIILMVIAGIKANDGEWYRYPFTLRLIK